MKIIGLGHLKQVGKDSAAKVLSDYYAFRHIAFADGLYSVASKLWGAIGFMSKQYYDKYPEDKEIPLDVLNKSPRQLLIELGNAVRSVHPDVWVNLALAPPYVYVHGSVVSDVRYPNEAEAIKNAGGLLIRIDRPSVEPSLDTADAALVDFDGWDEVIVNSGTLEDLREKVLGNEVIRSYVNT